MSIIMPRCTASRPSPTCSYTWPTIPVQVPSCSLAPHVPSMGRTNLYLPTVFKRMFINLSNVFFQDLVKLLMFILLYIYTYSSQAQYPPVIYSINQWLLLKKSTFAYHIYSSFNNLRLWPSDLLFVCVTWSFITISSILATYLYIIIMFPIFLNYI